MNFDSLAAYFAVHLSLVVIPSLVLGVKHRDAQAFHGVRGQFRERPVNLCASPEVFSIGNE